VKKYLKSTSIRHRRADQHTEAQQYSSVRGSALHKKPEKNDARGWDVKKGQILG